MNNQQKSTYALLVRSEEKSRGVLEIILYTLLILNHLFNSFPTRLIII